MQNHPLALGHIANGHAHDFQLSPEELGEEIEQACGRLRGRVTHTATIRLPWLDSPLQEVWAKLECHQQTGSFKYRGALNAVGKSSANSVITASAGNHALAICRAARSLSKTAHIIAPSNVSELKAKRILAEADSVTFYGRDLYEATLEAMDRADASCKPDGHSAGNKMEFISPYAAVDVAAGAGTLMSETLADAGQFDRVFVPLGGGGLAAAVAAWCYRHSPQTKVVCTHPEVFGREFAPGEPLSSYLSQSTESTLCDGLAVELVQRTPFASILDTLIAETVQVSETEVAAAIARALRFQSLLIEGSAATTIAALGKTSTDAAGKRDRVLLILTGANISSSNVARSLVTEVSQSDQRRGMGLRNISAPSDNFGSLAGLVNGQRDTAVGNATENETRGTAVENGTRGTAASPISILKTLASHLEVDLDKVQKQDEQKRRLCRQLNLQEDQWCLGVSSELLHSTQRLLEEFNRDLQHGPSMPYWVAEERYRTLLQLYSTVANMNERASASNDQATRIWFQDTAQQSLTACNYDRYGGLKIRETELGLLRTLRVASVTSVSLLLVSSGMAAYHILQQFVLQQLSYGDTIVLPPYIYFEASEQLQRFEKLFNIRRASTFHHKDLMHAAELHDARVLFIDALANIVDLPVTDLRSFGQEVSNRPGWEKRWVIVDGTMVSGATEVFDWFQGPYAPTVLLSESFSKYAQMGLDLQMAGAVIYPSHLDSQLRKIRRDMGAILYPRGASLIPRLDYDLYQTRLQHLSSNAEMVYHHVKKCVSDIANVRFPIEWREFGWRHGGALVTVEFLESGLNNREGLDAYIELVLSAARRVSLPLTKGVSFGFSTSRISASSSMAEGSDPFLRLSVGVDEEHALKLAEIVAQAARKYCHVYSESKL